MGFITYNTKIIIIIYPTNYGILRYYRSITDCCCSRGASKLHLSYTAAVVMSYISHTKRQNKKLLVSHIRPVVVSIHTGNTGCAVAFTKAYVYCCPYGATLVVLLSVSEKITPLVCRSKNEWIGLAP